MTSTDLRPLSIGEILDTSFQLYRRYFVTLATIGVYGEPEPNCPNQFTRTKSKKL